MQSSTAGASISNASCWGPQGWGVLLCPCLFRRGVSQFLPSLGLPRAHTLDA